MTIPQCLSAERGLRRCFFCDKPLNNANKTGVCSNCQSKYKDWRSKMKNVKNL